MVEQTRGKKGWGETDEVRQQIIADPERAEDIIEGSSLHPQSRARLRREFGVPKMDRRGTGQKGATHAVRQQILKDPMRAREIIGYSDLHQQAKKRLRIEFHIPIRSRH